MISETKVVNKRTHIKTDNDVYIGRGSIWGNPFPINEHQDRKKVCELYKEYLNCQPDLLERIDELKNKNLVCYCSPLQCHGDYLKQIAELGTFHIIAPSNSIMRGALIRFDDTEEYYEDEFSIELPNGIYIDFGYYYSIDSFIILVFNKDNNEIIREEYDVNNFLQIVSRIQNLVKEFS